MNCYADTWSKRTGHGNLWRRHGERRFFGEKHWAEPLKWNRDAEAAGERRRVFCASMSDVFEAHPDPAVRGQMEDARGRLFELIADTPNLDWLLLTKRPENVQGLTPSWDEYGWPPNVWLGTSVEDQRRADERIPLLLRSPAAIRFLSCEPLLGPVDLRDGLREDQHCVRCELFGGHWAFCRCRCHSNHIDWVIVGGESGSSRGMDLAWARSLVEQSAAAGVACFVKQLGSVWARANGAKDPKGGDPDEWPADLRVRQFPRAAVRA